MKQLQTIEDINKYQVDKERKLFSANHHEIESGLTSDVYFVQTKQILEANGYDQSTVTAEIFSRRSGIVAGIDEALGLLDGLDVKIEALPEGASFKSKDVLMRITGHYTKFGIYETAILGMLAHSSAWATAAYEISQVTDGKPFICFGARHVHPAVAPVMERAAMIGGASGASCILGAKLLGKRPSGTVPHALFLIVGDTLKGAQMYDQLMPAEASRTILVDTFKDEVEEAIRLSEALGSKLDAIRLDTPSERGGVTPDLVKEVRAKLDLNGHHHVKLFASGGLDIEKIKLLSAAGVDAFGVGSYISGATPIDMTMDIKEIDGKPVAKRGRIPGITPTEALNQVR